MVTALNLTERYSSLVSNADEYTFHILGCGAIGSSAAIQLSRMGARYLCLYDMDIVEEANIGVSQYDTTHLGKPKVDSLKSILMDINPVMEIKVFNEEFSEFYYQFRNDIAILGFDSMETRLLAVEACCKDPIDKPLHIIDGRMGAEHYQQYVITKPTLSKYNKIWYSDDHGDIEPCNAKATSYCSNMSGSFIANTVRKLITNQPYNSKFSFNFPTMLLEKTKMIG